MECTISVSSVTWTETLEKIIGSEKNKSKPQTPFAKSSAHLDKLNRKYSSRIDASMFHLKNIQKHSGKAIAAQNKHVRHFSKQITFGTDARAAMLSGVEQLADAVSWVRVARWQVHDVDKN